MEETLNTMIKKLICGTEEEMRNVAAKLCKNCLTGSWKNVEPSALEFRRISGGLTNFLYYVALPEDKTRIIDEPSKVLLRIYGQVHGERAVDAIVTESIIFTLLSERRLGPKLHGVFPGGRIEEYIPARPLNAKEISDPAISMKIAEKMAAIHSMDVPLSKEPNWLWKTMGKWLKIVREERLNSTAGLNEVEKGIAERIKNVNLEKEIEWLKKFLSTVESPVVFCHNDLQRGNILLLEDSTTSDDDLTAYENYTHSPKSDKENNHTANILNFEDTNDSVLSHISDNSEPKLVIIDYEYCAYNYRGFDIANHMAEWGFDYGNPQHPFYFENSENFDNCPTLEQKEIFIKEYLKHCQRSEESIEEVNQLLGEVEAFTVATHLIWSLWSIVNASKSKIPFGYWEYALTRLETYLRLKQEIMKKDKYPQKRKICEVDI